MVLHLGSMAVDVARRLASFHVYLKVVAPEQDGTVTEAKRDTA